MVRLAQKAFHPGPIPFPAAARRHHLQISGDDRVPRPFLRGNRRQAHRPHQSPGNRRGRQPLPPGNSEMLRPAQDARPARCPQRGRLRRGFRRRAPRRREIARQGTRLLASATLSDSGIPRISVPNSGTCTIAASIRARASASSRFPTGPNWTSGTTSIWRTFRSCRSTSPKAPHGGARRSADPGGAQHAPAARGSAADGDVPHALARLYVTAPAPSVPRPTRCLKSSKR